jgi:protocatechuate 3,4-dioxygenase beta subunit
MRVITSLWLSVATALLAAVPASAAITGTVINTDGAPIGGAKVSLFAPETIEARRTRLVASTDRTPLVTTTTGLTGNFSLESPKGQPLFDLQIEASAYAPSGTRVLPDEEIGAQSLTPAPIRSGTITGNGKPVAGATVIWFGDGEYATRTDANGKYSIPDPDKWATRLMILHPDFAPLEELLGQFGTNRKGPDRALLGGVAVKGRVVAADGTTPVAKATILVENWPLATSGDDGTFSVAHAPKDWTEANALAGDRAAARARVNGDVTLKLAKAGAISGIVRDARTQAGVAGVEVRITAGQGARGATPLRTAFTDAKGSYTLTPVTAGLYSLGANKPSFSSQPVNVAVSAGQTVQKAIYLNERGRISGSVVDEDKRPVAGTRVGVRNGGRGTGMMAMMGPMGPMTWASSAPDGRYVLRAVDPNPEVIVEAAKRGLPNARTAAMKLSAGEKKIGVNLVIPRGVSFSGKVTDAAGKPLSGVTVDPSESDDSGPGFGVRRMMIAAQRTPGDDRLVRTGSDGGFSLKLKEGKYDIIFKRDAFAARTLRGQQVNATSKPVEVTLDAGVEITGHITRGGMPVEAVNVTAVSQDGLNNAQTLPDGTFRIGDLTPGSYMLTVNKMESFVQTMRSVTAPARDVAIELPAGGRISGHVTDKTTHQPVTAFQAGVTTSRGGGGMMVMMPPMTRQFTTDDGSFTLENVPPGQTQVVVNAPGFTTGRVSGLNVEDGKSIDNVEVGLDTGVKLVGRVTGPDGGPLSGVSVGEDDMAGGGRVMRVNTGVGGGGAVTDPNGEYTIDSLEPGEKTFTFNRAGYLGEQKTVTLSGRETRLDAQLSSGRSVMGQVVSEAGGPVADATVSASSAAEGFGQRTARSDAGGNFQFEGLAPGHYNFTASKNGYAQGWTRDFDISTGTPVRVVLKSGGIITGHVAGLAERDLANATVTASNTNGSASSPVDAGGNYRIEGAPTGSVRVSARTGQMFGGGMKTSPVQTVQLEPGGTATADLEFKNDTVVRGRVSRNGRPVPNAMVAFFPKNGRVATGASASSDGNGAYEISGLQDAQYTVQVVDMDRITPFTTTYEVKGSGTFDIDVTGASVRGRVTDATSGQPVADAHVEIRARGNESFLAGRGAQTDGAGNFAMESVAAGTYTATVEKSGYGSDTKDLTVSTSDADLQFKISPSSGVTLRVVDARDQRLLMANVHIVDAMGRDIDPPFFRPGSPEPLKLSLAPGTYRITVGAMGYASRMVSVTAPSDQIVALTPGGTLVIRSKASTTQRARLVDGSGNVYMRSFAQSTFMLDPSPGATTINNIAGGVYRLEILDSRDAVVNTTAVTVVDGQQVEVAI